MRCQYRQLAYETIVGLFQCNDTRFAIDLYTTIEEEGEEEFISLGDWEVPTWLCRRLVVSETEGAEMMRQLWAWTQMLHKMYLSNLVYGQINSVLSPVSRALIRSFALRCTVRTLTLRLTKALISLSQHV
jgi:hypothetical protein